MNKRSLLYILLTLAFSVNGHASRTPLSHEEIDAENPFLTMVRFYPCELIKDQFKAFCQEKIDQGENLGYWQNAHNKPVATLREYVAEYIKKRGTRKLVVDCHHAPEGKFLVDKPKYCLLSDKNENHTHGEAITITSGYKALSEDKNGPFIKYWLKETEPVVELITDQPPCQMRTLKIDQNNFEMISSMQTDFVRPGYPFLEGVDDFPEGYFTEIFMERARYHMGIARGGPEGLPVLFRHLAIGGKLAFEFDGNFTLEDLPDVPGSTATIAPAPVGWIEYFSSFIFTPKPFEKSRNFEGCKIQYTQETGEYCILLDHARYNDQALVNQFCRWAQEAWCPKGLQITPEKMKEDKRLLYYEIWSRLRPLSPQNETYFRKLWEEQMHTVGKQLLDAGFRKYESFYNVKNPWHGREKGRYMVAYK